MDVNKHVMCHIRSHTHLSIRLSLKVGNAAMAQARRELKTRQLLGSKMSYEQELEEADRLAEVMKAERAKEKEAQAKQVGSVGAIHYDAHRAIRGVKGQVTLCVLASSLLDFLPQLWHSSNRPR